ncbi:class II aldolase/adducin family protein [Candidatus Woesearchaeota archaeon]|nr:class II aldolase/adducin family protein [Candidatus Woesearchaeota archaeon]
MAFQDNPEGVIKFNSRVDKDEPPSAFTLRDLDVYRQKLRDLELIGGSERGKCYGNISIRHPVSIYVTLPEGHRSFIITGTQTGCDITLQNKDYLRVTRYDIMNNRVYGRGVAEPSSESLTHAALYDISDKILAVIHVHYSGLWNSRHRLNIPTTAPGIEYGTLEMALDMKRVHEKIKSEHLDNIIAMESHRDGILTFGRDLQEAFNTLIKYHDRLNPNSKY